MFVITFGVGVFAVSGNLSPLNFCDLIKVMNFGQIRERSVLFLIIIDLKAGLLFLFLLKLGYIQ